MAVPYMFFLTPILGWSWPALTPILVATAGSLGYSLATKRVLAKRALTRLEKQLLDRRTVEIPLDEYLKDLVSEQVGYEEELQFEKDDLVLTFGHDARGKFFVRVTGPKERTAADLQITGEQFARALIQQFAYNRIAAEFDRRGIQVVEGTMDEEGNVVLLARRW